MLAGRPFQTAQSAITKWFGKEKPRWADNRPWKDLSQEQRVHAVKSYIRTRAFRDMKNLERKSTIAQYAHVITTQGYPMCGRRKGEKQGAPPKQGALKKEDFVTGLSLMLTIYPNVQQDLIESYGLQRFATMSIAAKTFKEDPIYAAQKLELEAFSPNMLLA